MDYVLVGKIVNTHGIKGEIRILSHQDYKDRIFAIGNCLLVGKEKEKMEIATYRRHKMFDMITIKGYNNINQVLQFVGKQVFIDRELLKLKDNEFLERDLIGKKVIFHDKELGICKSIDDMGAGNKVMTIIFENSKILLPYRLEFIKKVDTLANSVEMIGIEGMIK